MGDLARALKRRRMVRSFTPDPVPHRVVAECCDLARRSPSAGKAQFLDFVVLDEPQDVGRYWATTMDPDRRTTFRFQGLLHAPVLVMVWIRPQAHVERYAEPDKVGTGLGEGQHAWAVPYWWVDGGQALLALQLALADRGLGACLFGMFEHEQALAREFGVPEDRRGLGTIAAGWPAPDEAGASSGRPRQPLEDIVHRGTW